LISLLLGAERVLMQPFFYFSLYLKENRADYYDALQRVLFEEDQQRVLGLGRAAGSALPVYELLKQRVTVSAPKAGADLADGQQRAAAPGAARHRDRGHR
jgi:hypothetical protein